MVLSYDRRIPKEFLGVLEPGGWAHSLVEYGRSGQYALDLQLRGYADKQGHWATLYVGLTKVVDLHYRPSKGFRLSASPTYRQQKLGWHTNWERTQPAQRLADEWSSVESYLERVIPTIGPRYLKEGAVQSAISGFASHDLVVIDREATIAFSSQQERRSTSRRLRAPLLDAVKRSNGSAWWKAKPRTLGGECDALAMTRDGRLRAIEIKPAKATQSIAWAPLQARHYANLLNKWASEAQAAADVVRGMLEQRIRLGLADAVTPRVEQPIRVTPVIAIERGYSKAAIERLTEVQQRLVDAGLNDPPLQMAVVNLVGRLDPITL